MTMTRLPPVAITTSKKGLTMLSCATIRTVKSVSPYALWELWEQFTRDDLRIIARQNKIPIGRNKTDTIRNLVEYRGKLAKHRIYISFHPNID